MSCVSEWPFLALGTKRSILLLCEMHPLDMSPPGDRRGSPLSRQLPAGRQTLLHPCGQRFACSPKGEGLFLSQNFITLVCLSVLAIPGWADLLQQYPAKGLLIRLLQWQ